MEKTKNPFMYVIEKMFGNKYISVETPNDDFEYSELFNDKSFSELEDTAEKRQNSIIEAEEHNVTKKVSTKRKSNNLIAKEIDKNDEDERTR